MAPAALRSSLPTATSRWRRARRCRLPAPRSGAAGKVFFNGTIPTADATGILPRIVGTNDFITYNGTTGMTPYTGYATDFSTPGRTSPSPRRPRVASSVNINALKRTELDSR